MKKTVVSVIMAGAMALSLVACGGNKPETKPEAEATQTEAAQETEAAQTEAQAAQDGQNPVMNFVGPYACDRANILVEADGNDGARFTVMWGSSATETTQWVMSGKFDPNTLTATYENCVKTDLVYNEDGSVASQNVVYENGKGSMTFVNGDKVTLTWQDDNEHVADGMTFTFNF